MTRSRVLVEGLEDSPMRVPSARSGRRRGRPAGEVVRRMNEAIDNRPEPPLGLMSLPAAAANGRGRWVFPQESPSASYTRCLKDSCGDCGGCWSDEMWIARLLLLPWDHLRPAGAGRASATPPGADLLLAHIFRYLPP